MLRLEATLPASLLELALFLEANIGCNRNWTECFGIELINFSWLGYIAYVVDNAAGCSNELIAILFCVFIMLGRKTWWTLNHEYTDLNIEKGNLLCSIYFYVEGSSFVRFMNFLTHKFKGMWLFRYAGLCKFLDWLDKFGLTKQQKLCLAPQQ